MACMEQIFPCLPFRDGPVVIRQGIDRKKQTIADHDEETLCKQNH